MASNGSSITGPPAPGQICANYNGSGSLGAHFQLDYTLADTTKVVCGSLSFLLVLPFVLFEIKCFPIGTTTSVLTGAALMVITTVLTQEDVYHLLGETENLRTIFLLLGMMLLAQFFEREKMIGKILKMSLKESHSFANYIWRVSLVTFIFAALFTNDAACVVLTPIFLKYWEKQKRKPAELQTLLLAIATSANIGSVTTIFGNPQMALIASRTDTEMFRLSTLTLVRSIIYLGVPALIAFFINFGFLMLHFEVRSRLKMRKYGIASTFSKARTNDPCTNGQNSPGEDYAFYGGQDAAGQIQDGQVQTFTKVDSNNGNCVMDEVPLPNTTPITDNAFDIALSKSSTKSNKKIEVEQQSDVAYQFKQSHSMVFKVFLCVLLTVVIILMFIKLDVVAFDIGLVPMAGATLALVVDAALNKRNASVIMGRVDWGVIMMFFGIFVWLHGINTTRIPRWIWKQMGLADANLDDTQTIVILCVFVIFCSNIFSNVPLTIIVLDQLEPCKNQFALVLYLAWCSTIAGNLTLFGSVANLLVAQKARETLDEPLTFMGYLKYGFVSTLIIVIIGIPIIYGLLLI
ncbi:uncharacterized protein LOC126832081 [Patella vulgata]|uniref:uncharacterized protein LOC126832081 n=1 Tax=Patella vulgata TaxID=6465 RepID=UPI00217FB198|nr:uncharacterized protein LOC126832081 [Patella vulgata]XP_050418720.1 uncharacterized protein LOC126832081 [Patella vulgata]